MAPRKHPALISTKKHLAPRSTAKEITRAVGLTQTEMKEIRASLAKHGRLMKLQRARAARNGTQRTAPSADR